jgi:hypothetical protein
MDDLLTQELRQKYDKIEIQRHNIGPLAAMRLDWSKETASIILSASSFL